MTTESLAKFAVYTLENCPLFALPIGEETCIMTTRMLHRNQEGCLRHQCRSPQRRCVECLLQGEWRDVRTLVVDFERGLCAAHAGVGGGAYIDRGDRHRYEAQRQADGWPHDYFEGGARGGGVTQIPIRLICSKKDRLRKRFDPQALDDLARSIQDIGQLEPILVRPVYEQRCPYEVIDGERRLRAHYLAGRMKIDAIIMNTAGDEHTW